MDSSLQRLDKNCLIEQLEKDQRKLEEETKQPESGQFWDLAEHKTRDLNLGQKHTEAVCVWVFAADLFLQISCISQVEPDGFYESHEDEDGDEDELVVVGQSRILRTGKDVII